MSLAARVSAFFLATLALVLAGVSVTLYLLTSAHLHRDLDERLGLALDSLATSVDVDPGRVEWNPSGRSVLVVHPDNEPVLWLVTDSRGVTIDRTWDVDADRSGRDGEARAAEWALARNADRREPAALAFGTAAGLRLAGGEGESGCGERNRT